MRPTFLLPCDAAYLAWLAPTRMFLHRAESEEALVLVEPTPGAPDSVAEQMLRTVDLRRRAMGAEVPWRALFVVLEPVSTGGGGALPASVALLHHLLARIRAQDRPPTEVVVLLLADDPACLRSSLTNVSGVEPTWVVHAPQLRLPREPLARIEATYLLLMLSVLRFPSAVHATKPVDYFLQPPEQLGTFGGLTLHEGALATALVRQKRVLVAEESSESGTPLTERVWRLMAQHPDPAKRGWTTRLPASLRSLRWRQRAPDSSVDDWHRAVRREAPRLIEQVEAEVAAWREERMEDLRTASRRLEHQRREYLEQRAKAMPGPTGVVSSAVAGHPSEASDREASDGAGEDLDIDRVQSELKRLNKNPSRAKVPAAPSLEVAGIWDTSSARLRRALERMPTQGHAWSLAVGVGAVLLASTVWVEGAPALLLSTSIVAGVVATVSAVSAGAARRRWRKVYDEAEKRVDGQDKELAVFRNDLVKAVKARLQRWVDHRNRDVLVLAEGTLMDRARRKRTRLRELESLVRTLDGHFGSLLSAGGVTPSGGVGRVRYDEHRPSYQNPMYQPQHYLPGDLPEPEVSVDGAVHRGLPREVAIVVRGLKRIYFVSRVPA